MADCVDPGPAPKLADGATATEAEMAASHTAVQKFVNALQSYQQCLEQQIRSAGPDIDVNMRQAWRAQGNAAVDLAHEVAEDYEDRYRVYKSHH